MGLCITCLTPLRCAVCTRSPSCAAWLCWVQHAAWPDDITFAAACCSMLPDIEAYDCLACIAFSMQGMTASLSRVHLHCRCLKSAWQMHFTCAMSAQIGVTTSHGSSQLSSHMAFATDKMPCLHFNQASSMIATTQTLQA